MFPNATVISSTFEAFAAYLDTVPDYMLPEITSEIGDTWIHGVASDPRKVARTRWANRLRTQCVNAGDCDMSDPRVRNFSRLLLKNGEHTWYVRGVVVVVVLVVVVLVIVCHWSSAETAAHMSILPVECHVSLRGRGLDQKIVITNHRSNWSNAEFDIVRVTEPAYAAMEESWVRQAQWGLDIPMTRLGDHPLRAQIQAAWDELAPSQPNTNQSKFIPASDLQVWRALRIASLLMIS